MTVYSVVLAALIAGTAAVLPAQQPTGSPPSADTTAMVHGIDRADLDTTCAACADFYQFATGGWRAHHPIPAVYPRWGSFDVLQEHNRATVREVLEEAAREASGSPSANAPSGSAHAGTSGDKAAHSATVKVGLYYATCMDSAAVEAAGMTPIKPELARLAAVATPGEFRREAARLQAMRGNDVFGVNSQQDPKKSTDVILQLSQGGLGLPDRDYYLKTDSASAAVRAAYTGHIARVLALAGDDDATAKSEADRVMALETSLARIARPRTERRDPYAVYHLMPLADAEKLVPHASLAQWLVDADVPHVTSVNVADPDFFRSLDTLLATVPIADWRTYLRWHFLASTEPWLDSRFVAEDFRMESILNGTKEMLPRWQRCVRVTDQSMGEALGQAYVARTFPPEAKARALAMVRNMEAVLREDLGTLAWMSPATRQQAITKLDAYLNKIGYPDTWRDYSKLDVARRPFVANFIAAADFDYARRINKIGHPPDRMEWTMSPPTVNAYYNPSINEVVFPAGILQPPFFDPKAPDAVNYGGIGAAIGHEMTHGFDDQGRKFDAQGNLHDWWTPEDAKGFQQRAQGIVDQFNGYTVNDSLHVNGKLTQGENIADLGGLKIAYAALERSLANKPREMDAGFTPEQQFFLSWARIWATTSRPEFARNLILTDPHSPGRWRVDGPLSNMPEFAAAFHCQAGDAMVRPADQRVSIW
jgi:putative endopeptidase